MATPQPLPQRHRLARVVMKPLSGILLRSLAKLKIEGEENLPETGPVIFVANHFSDYDVAGMLVATKGDAEFWGGARFLNAGILGVLPKIYGYFPVRRGGISLRAMRSATKLLQDNGRLIVFPEGGAWAEVLRPARPGTAYLAAKTQVSVLPVGLDGFPEIFRSLRRGKRQCLTVRFGKPLPPPQPPEDADAKRAYLEDYGEQIMRAIAALIPEERHGVYSSDEAVREAAAPHAVYPFAHFNG